MVNTPLDVYDIPYKLPADVYHVERYNAIRPMHEHAASASAKLIIYPDNFESAIVPLN